MFNGFELYCNEVEVAPYRNLGVGRAYLRRNLLVDQNRVDVGLRYRRTVVGGIGNGEDRRGEGIAASLGFWNHYQWCARLGGCGTCGPGAAKSHESLKPVPEVPATEDPAPKPEAEEGAAETESSEEAPSAEPAKPKAPASSA